MKLAALISTSSIDSLNQNISNATPGTESGIIVTAIKDIVFGQMWVILMSVILFLILAYGVYGGILYFTAYGNEEKIKKGKLTMVWAIVGAIVVASAFMIVRYVAGKLLEVPASTINQGLNP